MASRLLEPAQRCPRAPVKRQPDARTTHPGHCPVLIVEDDADLREMMAQLLQLEGYRAETVANGRAALRCATCRLAITPMSSCST